ncbi:hypothetical protein GIB67_015838 [Kingdonia uniflora]|uniref:KIB1-4 beta-propeller domain-containing protein n=1 Tax=Kingdonia uniflora TaxID=39325 RepID=A0A7J7NEB0_9MAGN|nr:hypothetical protein GIB67_015838 [Kingdonia uniflora]
MVNVNTKKARMSKKPLFPNWADLHSNLLELIIDKLIPIRDRICFGAVCLSWYSVFRENRLILPLQLPLLTLVPRADNYRHEPRENLKRTLYTVGKSGFHHLQFPNDTYYTMFASSKGWLLTGNVSSFLVRLLNPFISVNNTINLPTLPELINSSCPPYDQVRRPYKVVLSADPILSSNPGPYEVMVIYGYNSYLSGLAYFRAGDTDWTKVEDKMGFDDIIYYRNKFYSVSSIGTVYVYDDNLFSKKMGGVQSDSYGLGGEFFYYLVESLGELLVVRRCIARRVREASFTRAFTVYKHDPIALKWVKLKTLCNQTLFLGNNSSFSVSALDFAGYKPNCIYFTNDCHLDIGKFDDLPSDMGMFDLADESFKNPSLEQEFFPTFIEPKLD